MAVLNTSDLKPTTPAGALAEATKVASERSASAALNLDPDRKLRSISVTISVGSNETQTLVFTPRQGSQPLITETAASKFEKSVGSTSHLGDKVNNTENFLRNAIGGNFRDVVNVTFPNSRFGPVSLAWLRKNEIALDHSRVQDRNDTLSKTLTKAALLDTETVKKLFSGLGDKPLVVFLDFNAMGVANRFGLRENINALIREMGPLVEECLGSRGAKLIRIGGDEFAILLKNQPGSVEDLKSFESALSDRRKKLFVPDSAEMKQASESAYIRGIKRTLMKEFLSERAQKLERDPLSVPGRFKDRPTIGEFQVFLAGRARALGLPLLPIGENKVRENISARISMQIARHLYQSGQDVNRDFVMSFSKGIVEIPSGTTITPEVVLRSLGKGAAIVHDIKAKKLPADFAQPQPLTDAIKLRPEELLQIQHGQATKQQLESLTTFYNETNLSPIGKAFIVHTINTAIRSDPGVIRVTARPSTNGKWVDYESRDIEQSGDPLQVTRINLAARVPVCELFGIEKAKQVNVIRFDIPGFGAINNNHDYDRGDAIFSAVATIVSDSFPGAHLVRENGGGLLVVTDEHVDEAELKTRRDAINKVIGQSFEKYIENEMSLAEWFNEKERRIVELSAQAKTDPTIHAVIQRWENMHFSDIFVERQSYLLKPSVSLTDWVRELDTKGWEIVT